MEPVTQFGEITISYKMISDWKKLPIITASYEAVKYIYEFFPYDTIALQEHFIVTYLNRSNRVLGVYHSSIGGINSTVVDPRLILGTALKLAASGIILAHNHPSGSMKPSPQDKEITYKLRDGSMLLDIKVLDHLIVGPNKDEFYSFADEGIL